MFVLFCSLAYLVFVGVDKGLTYGLGYAGSFVLYIMFNLFIRKFPGTSFILIIIFLISGILSILLTLEQFNRTSFELVKFGSVYAGVLFMLLFRCDDMFRYLAYKKESFFAEDYPYPAITNMAHKISGILTKISFSGNTFKWVLVVALLANIAEATLVDFQTGYYLNGIVGVYIILLLPREYFPCIPRW